MKIRQLLVLIGISLITGTALADIQVQSFTLSNCDNFTGKWSGSGTVKATVIFPIVCQYNGVATVTPTNSNNYNVHVDLKKTAGICPDSEILDLPGSCHNGDIHLQTDKANLHGSMNAAGTEAALAGTVQFSIGGTNITADITDMNLKKQ
jgi:hypothetical protein